MKVLSCLLVLIVSMFSPLAHADWSVGMNFGGGGYHHDDRHFYHWHEHPHWGLHIGFLPDGYTTIWTGGQRYYYYDGLYYTYAGAGDYILVNPPMGAYVAAIPPDFQAVMINGRTYYTDNGIYYILTRYHGYKVVAPPVVYAQPVIYTQPAPVVYTQPAPTVVTTQEAVPAPVYDQDSFPVNVPNNSGGYTAVVIKRSGNGYAGPQGEFYPTFPSVAQLKAMYGK